MSLGKGFKNFTTWRLVGMLKRNSRPAWGIGRRDVCGAVLGGVYFFQTLSLALALLLGVASYQAHAKLLEKSTFEITAPEVQAAAEDPARFYVKTQNGSWAQDKFIYSPDTGLLLRLAENREVTAVHSFGVIPGLTENDLEILSFSSLIPFESEEPSRVIVRHGVWMSIVDAQEDRLIMGNIGPVEPGVGGKWFNREVVVGGKVRYYTFVARTALRNHPQTPENAPDRELMNRLVMVDLETQSVGVLPLRSDIEPIEMRIVGTDAGAIRLVGRYHSPQPGSRNPFQKAEMIVDLKELNVTQAEGVSFFANRPISNMKVLRAVRGMFSNDQLAERLMLPGITSEQLMSQGNPNDTAAKTAALSLVQQKIADAKLIEGAVRDGLRNIHGQKDAIQALVALAQGRATAKKAQVSVAGGTTGTGKTSGVAAFAKALFPQKTQPVFEISFSENTEEKFLQTTLFGSAPGYIGMDTPSGLMVWLLANPDGGVLLFDEIEKAPPEAMKILMSFLDRQEVKITPQLLKFMIASYQEMKLEVEHWPLAIREATSNGTKLDVGVTLRLTPDHFIFLNTNAGASLYNGSGISNVASQRLETEQQLRAANARFNGEVIKAELRERGYEDEILNRVSTYIPFKVIMPEDHKYIVRDRLAEIEAYFKKEYFIDLTYSPEAYEYLVQATYSPLDGARFVENQLRKWVTSNLTEALFQTETLRAGQAVRWTLDPSDGRRHNQLVLVHEENGKLNELGRYNVGKAPPAAPTWILERAETRLLPMLVDRIRGHQHEKEQLANRTISNLKKAVKAPSKAGGVVSFEYSDGPPGTGKTEIAKVSAEAIFEDPRAMIVVEMNNINSMDDFYRMLVQPLKAAATSNPEGLVVLLDEFPRAGGDNPFVRKEIQQAFLSILDEGVLPAIPWETKTVGSKHVRENSKTPLPKATLFYATGNMIEGVLGPNAEFMTNNELTAQLLWLQKHPERFRSVYQQSFVAALRSRMGEPNVFMNLSDADLEWLRDEKFLPNALKLLKEEGVEVTLAKSAKDYFRKEQIAIRGGRWVRDKVEVLIEAPLNAWLLGVLKYRNSQVTVEFDADSREMRASVARGGKVYEEKVLAKVPRARSDVHPEVKQKLRISTHVHEAGHAVVMRALFGKDAVDRIVTFGGGDGGWTEFATDAKGHEPYLTTKGGPFHIAALLGGHLAEQLFQKGNTSNGASSDFSRARSTSLTMILDGSVLSEAPIAITVDPKNGQLQLSDAMKLELELKQKALLGFGHRLATWILKHNSKLIAAIAERMEANHQNFSIEREELEEIIEKTGLRVPSDKEIRKIMLADRKTHRTCREMLLNEDTTVLDRLLDFILRRK